MAAEPAHLAVQVVLVDQVRASADLLALFVVAGAPGVDVAGDHQQVGLSRSAGLRPYQSTRPVMFLMRSSRAMVNSSGLSGRPARRGVAGAPPP
jgi:hypothetical protein